MELMKDTLKELKYQLDKSLILEDVHHTEIEKFPIDDTVKTARITYTIFLK